MRLLTPPLATNYSPSSTVTLAITRYPSRKMTRSRPLWCILLYHHVLRTQERRGDLPKGHPNVPRSIDWPQRRSIHRRCGRQVQDRRQSYRRPRRNVHQPKKIPMDVEPFKVHLWSSIRHTPGLHRQRLRYRTQPRQGLCHHQHEMDNMRKGYTEAHRVHGCSQPLYIVPWPKGSTTL